MDNFKKCVVVDNNEKVSFNLCHIFLLHILELYIKSLTKLQFVYSKRKVSTKLFYAPKGD